MAGAIKGITVEIGGDTTKLTKALNSVDKETKSLQKELKGVESLLKMDPGNTELLAQKQKILAESVENTSEKLKKLKEVQDQIKKQYENGEIGEKEYRDFQREIVATEEKLKKLTKAQEEFGSVTAQKVAAAGENVKEIGGKIEGAGKAIMPVSAAVAGLGAAAVAAYAEMDKGYDTIVKATGATGEALEGLKNSADNVFSGMNVDIESVGGAIGEVNTRFGYTGEKLENLTNLFLQFSKITGQDVVAAIGSVDKIEEAWNIDASKTNEVLGLLAGKAQETGISVEALEAAALENNAIFKEMGFTFEQSIALMAEFERNGVNSSTAIAGLKKSVQNATKEGKTAGQAISEVVDSIKNAADETEALSIASELFGNKGAPEMVHAIREGRLSFDELNISMSDYAKTVGDTYNATLDGKDKMAAAFNALKVAGKELGETIMEVAAPAIEKLGEAARALAERIKSMPEGMQKLVVVVGAIVAALGPLLVVGGKLVQGIGSIMTMAPQIQAAFTAISGVIGGISAPVLAIVAAVGLLVAAFVSLMQNNEEFREKIMGIWEEITSTLSGFFQGIVDRLNELGFNFQDIGEVIKAVWNGLCEFLAPVFEFAFSEVAEILKGVTEIILGLLDVFIGIFTGDWEKAWNGVKEVFGAIWDFLVATLKNILNLFLGIFGDALAAIGKAWTDAWNGIKQFFVDTWNNIVNGIKNFFSTIISAAAQWGSDMVNRAKETATKFFDAVVNGIKSLPDKIKSVFSDAVKHAAQWVRDMATKGKEAISSLISNVVEAAKGIPSAMLDIGRSIVSGVWNGIQNAKDRFFENIKSFFSGLVDRAKDALGIHSPSRVFRDEVGKQIPAGIAAGIKNNSHTVLQAVRDMFSDLRNENTKNVKAMSTAATSIVSSTVNAAKKITNESSKAASDYVASFFGDNPVTPYANYDWTVSLSTGGPIANLAKTHTGGTEIVFNKTPVYAGEAGKAIADAAKKATEEVSNAADSITKEINGVYVTLEGNAQALISTKMPEVIRKGTRKLENEWYDAQYRATLFNTEQALKEGNTIVQNAVDDISNYAKGATTAIQGVTQALSNEASAASKSISSDMQSALSSTSSAVEEAKRFIIDVYKRNGYEIEGLCKKYGIETKEAFSDVPGYAGEAGTDAANALIGKFNDTVSSKTFGSEEVFYAVEEGLVAALVLLEETIEQLKVRGIEAGQLFIENITTVMDELPVKFKEIFQKAIKVVKQWSSDLSEKGREAISAANNVMSETASELPDIMRGIGADVVDGLWRGIKSKRKELKKNVQGFLNDIVETSRDSLGIASPSKVFAEEVGKWIPAGIGEGVKKNREAALKPLKELLDTSTVIPTQTINSSITATLSGHEGISQTLADIYARLEKMGDNKIYLDGRTLVGGIIDRIDGKMGVLQAQKARGM